MPRYLDTRGNSTISVAICARCSRKRPWVELRPDPNSPGLMCCPEDVDQIDPWRLPPRPADRISLEWARPDVSLSPGPQQVPVLALQAAIGVNPGVLVPYPASMLEPLPDDGLEVAPDEALEVAPAGIARLPQPGLSLIEARELTGIAAAPAVNPVYQPVTWTASTYYRLGQNIVPTDPEGLNGAGNEFYNYTCIVPGLSGSTPPVWPTAQGVMVQSGDAWFVNAGLWLP